MSTGKVSIFITVLAFHASILAVVFLTTRPETITISPEDSAQLSAKSSAAKADQLKVDQQKKLEKKYLIHTVGSNEYLGKIAAKYKVSAKAIIDLNEIKNPNRIAKGRKLKIPLK